MKKLFWILIFFGVVLVACDKKVVYPPISPSPVTKISPSLISFDNWSANVDGITYKHNELAFQCDVNFQSPDYYVSVSFYTKTTGVYILSNKNSAAYSALYPTYNLYKYYYTDSIHTGIVTLTELDTINHLASGAFWFAAEEQSPTVNGGIDSVKYGYFTNLTW